MMTDIKTVEELSTAARREKKFYDIISIILLAAGSYLFFEFSYHVANMLGAYVSGTPEQAILQLKRMLPLILCTVALVHQGLSLLYAYKSNSKKKKALLIRLSGIVSMLFGLAIMFYTLKGTSSGFYESINEAYPTMFFPVDIIIGGILMFLFGYIELGEGIREKKHPSSMPCVKEDRNLFTKILDIIFYPLCYMVVLYSVAATVYSFFVMDFAHGYFLFNIIFICNLALPGVMYIYYRYIYFTHTEKYRKKVGFGMSIFFSIGALFLTGALFFVIQLQPEAPAQNAFGLLPIEFTASVNAFPFIFGLTNISASLSALIKHAVYLKKHHLSATEVIKDVKNVNAAKNKNRVTEYHPNKVYKKATSKSNGKNGK